MQKIFFMRIRRCNIDNNYASIGCLLHEENITMQGFQGHHHQQILTCHSSSLAPAEGVFNASAHLNLGMRPCWREVRKSLCLLEWVIKVKCNSMCNILTNTSHLLAKYHVTFELICI